MYSNYGGGIKEYSSNDTVHIGTIGIDVFKNNILIIDFPNQRFSVCTTIPNQFRNIPLVAITLDCRNRPLLPMHINGKEIKVLFYTGSSIFPLWTEFEKINQFSRELVTDTIEATTFGRRHKMTGRLIKEPFFFAGKSFTNVLIYANYTKSKNDREAVAGNVLFWDRVVVLDLKNKKFGFQ